DLYHPIGALVVGAVAGIIFVKGFHWTQEKLKIDDVLGVWPLHGLCGLWGGIAAGIFGLQALGGMGGVSLLSQVIGSIAVFENTVNIGDEFEVIIPQYKYLHDNDISNEFIIESKLEKKTESEALEAFINYIGNAVLVGHRIHYDIDILNAALAKMQCGRLRNEALDIEIMHRKLNDLPEKPFPLDELVRHYKIPETMRISSADDAYTNALLFLKLKSRLGIS
ncbi:MAG: hypothetical protein EOP49_37660, partial [Sphingobacteriales bacterium]